ncbi:MAG: ribonuclease III [Firmicutes bacterium]|nr:ribonuclease III [Bacillota bacterium]
MQTEPKQMDVLALAFLGDAVYELYIREHVLAGGTVRADRLHRECVRYVRAGAQAHVMEVLLAEHALTEEEEALARRAHNHKIATKPKNADPVEYKWATAFEALIGLLRVQGQEERAAELISRAIEITEAAEGGEDA